MDIRDKWMGIKMLKSTYNPIPFTRKTSNGQYVNFSYRAEHTAKYLAEVQWGPTLLPPHTFDFHFASPHFSHTALRHITLTDIMWAIRKLKRHKATGPDGIPMEFFKEMNLDHLEKIALLLNSWWIDPNNIPSSLTQAIVALIYK
eukprot:2296419-Karenia_brevis.AAC.1